MTSPAYNLFGLLTVSNGECLVPCGRPFLGDRGACASSVAFFAAVGEPLAVFCF